MKKKILLIILSILVLIGVGTLIFFLVDKDEKNVPKKENNTEEKEYYQAMHKRMYDYYKIMYKNIDVPEDKKDAPIRINLGTLKREGFPMDEFVSFDGKDECDLAMSYAIRKVVNNKYQIEVYYKCGTRANYDYTKVSTTKKINTTTKSGS